MIDPENISFKSFVVGGTIGAFLGLIVGFL
ncbi:hypothetical protein SAMN05421676_101370 [Salinibacillus kushneri]|uniref:Uncharacterized protein n=1 Tax=Salinibacillus kushneri TaxID=237682 RepID=A0A1H9Z244_9BACI|nr:hypothetical protein SAMN05421676_101370 [Salinibacillus kushneri]